MATKADHAQDTLRGGSRKIKSMSSPSEKLRLSVRVPGKLKGCNAGRRACENIHREDVEVDGRVEEGGGSRKNYLSRERLKSFAVSRTGLLEGYQG